MNIEVVQLAPTPPVELIQEKRMNTYLLVGILISLILEVT